MSDTPRLQRTIMKPSILFTVCTALTLLCGCDLPPGVPVKVESRPVIEPRPTSRVDGGVSHNERTAEISFDTARDERFAEFAGKAAEGMIRKIAVGIDRRGVMRIELGE